jgi:site-specific DNA recombinase
MTHEPLIDVAIFEQVQALRRTRAKGSQRAPRPTPRPYTLRGLLYCGVCERRMQGSWNNHAPYYRCVFLTQYAAKNKIDHPRAVYLREDQLLPDLDRWITQKFGPHALEQTLRELADAHEMNAFDPASEQARRQIADCDAKLRQHRAALEAGADPTLVTAWMAEVQAQRAAAETLTRHSQPRPRLSPGDIARIVAALGDLVPVLADADPAKKAETYSQLGLTLKYRPAERTVQVAARPMGPMYVRKCPRSESNHFPKYLDTSH